MHDQRSSTVAESEDRFDSAILGLLLRDDAQRPWAEDEIAREIGGPEGRIHVLDSLRRLYGAGLIHTFEGFVWATRAAVRSARLAQ